MKNETFQVAITEPRVRTHGKLSQLLPLLEIEAKLLGVKLNRLSGFKKCLRQLNRSIILN